MSLFLLLSSGLLLILWCSLEHLALMEVVLGKFPDRMARAAEWQQNSSSSREKFFRNGRLDWPGKAKSSSVKFVRKMKNLQVSILVLVFCKKTRILTC